MLKVHLRHSDSAQKYSFTFKMAWVNVVSDEEEKENQFEVILEALEKKSSIETV